MTEKTFEKDFPSWKGFDWGKLSSYQKELIQSFIKQKDIDRAKAKEVIDIKQKYIKKWMSKENAIYSPEYTQKQAQFEILKEFKKELGLKK